MGTAIDEVLTAGGATVDHIRSADPPGPVNGDIVVLAVYYPVLKDIIDQYAEELAGKIVVDITNPVHMETYEPIVPAEGSSAAELAAALPILPGAQGVQHQPCAHIERAEGWAPDHHGLGCRR